MKNNNTAFQITIIILLVAILAFAIVAATRSGAQKTNADQASQTAAVNPATLEVSDSPAQQNAEQDPAQAAAPTQTPEPTQTPVAQTPEPIVATPAPAPSFFLNIQPDNSGLPATVVIQEPDGTDAGVAPPKGIGSDIIYSTNLIRAQYGLGELTYRSDLQAAADMRARESAYQFSHTRPDGTACYTVLDNIDYYVTGENLILCDAAYASSDVLMTTWMNSEGHRANILKSDYTGIAVGVYVKDNVVYAAQIFIG